MTNGSGQERIPEAVGHLQSHPCVKGQLCIDLWCVV